MQYRREAKEGEKWRKGALGNYNRKINEKYEQKRHRKWQRKGTMRRKRVRITDAKKMRNKKI